MPSTGPDTAPPPLAPVRYSLGQSGDVPNIAFGGLLPAPASRLVTATQEAEVEEREPWCLGGPWVAGRTETWASAVPSGRASSWPPAGGARPAEDTWGRHALPFAAASGLQAPGLPGALACVPCPLTLTSSPCSCPSSPASHSPCLGLRSPPLLPLTAAVMGRPAFRSLGPSSTAETQIPLLQIINLVPYCITS